MSLYLPFISPNFPPEASERAMLGLQQQLLRNVTLWSGSEAVTVKDCSEQSDVLMFKERALRTQFEDGRETFVNRSGVSCCIVSRGIEDAVWFDGMFAKSGGHRCATA
jgi:hypothetical protein